MAEFKGVSEKFNVSVQLDDTSASEKVVCQVGLDGLFILSADGRRTLRKYPLNHISRWALRGNNLVLYTKTPVDVEERTVTLQSTSETTIRSVLDTLTCSCMQMVEVLQSKEQNGENAQATNSLTNLLNGNKKKTSLPADEVEYWKEPEKAGWMQGQGEVIKTWRRRWFVLKQGYLFRFGSAEVLSSTKPRGIVDLSKVTDVSEARELTGRPNSLKLSTATGHVAYICDSETELVEWVSALEGAVAKIVKAIAGVDEEPAPAPVKKTEVPKEWEKSFAMGTGASTSSSSKRPSQAPSGRGDSRNDRNTMVNIVGYSDAGVGSGPPRRSTSVSDSGYGSIDYGSIAGLAGVVGSDRSQGSSSVVKVDYPAYPSLQPSRPAQQHQQAQQPSYSNGPAYPSLVPSNVSSQLPGGYGASWGSSAYYPQGSAAPQQQQGGYYAPQQDTSVAPPQQQQQQAYGDPYAAVQQPAAVPATSYGDYAQQSAYQGYQQPPAQAQGSAEAEAKMWQVHYTGEGSKYFFNPSTGLTQWETPVGWQ